MSVNQDELNKLLEDSWSYRKYGVLSGGDNGVVIKGIVDRTITDISLPSDLTKIGSYAFYNCSKLTLKSLPSGITAIGPYSFFNCSSLALTVIPSKIDTIDSNAFYSCTGLKELTFKGKPTSIASGAFNSCANLLTINVPWSEGEVPNAPWGATKATINYNYVS